MNKIIKALTYIYLAPTRIGKDKLAHFFSSAISLSIMLLFFSAFIAYGFIFVSALFKELYYDGFLGKGKMEFQDFLYSSLPIVLHIIS